MQDEPVVDPGTGEEPELPAGSAVATLDGKDVPAVVTVQGTGVNVASGPVDVLVESIGASGKVLRPDDDARLEVEKGGTIRVEASGFEPGAALVGWVFSTPHKLGVLMADGSGHVSGTFRLPADIAGGSHTLQVNGQGVDGYRSLSLGLHVDDTGLPIWHAIDNPQSVLTTQVTVFALTSLALVGGMGAMAGSLSGLASAGMGTAGALGAAGAGAAGAGGSGGSSSSRQEAAPPDEAGESRSVNREAAERKARANAWTWRAPGQQRADRLSRSLPVTLSRLSPLLGRLANDGAHLRAALGSLALLFPLAGGIVGAAAAAAVTTAPVPPLALAVAGVVLGILDAGAGFAAGIAFLGGLAALGHLGTGDDLRVSGGVVALFFAVPLFAAAIRPLRRPPARDIPDAWYRGGDFVILVALSWWLVVQIVAAFPGLYGHEVPLGEHAWLLGSAAAGAMVLRLLFEELVARCYPHRLEDVASGDLHEQSRWRRLLGTGLIGAFFVFVSLPFIGNRVELWVGALLFVVSLPGLMEELEPRLPKSERLYEFLPRGPLKLAVMVAVCYGLSTLLQHRISSPADLMAISFVVLGVPGLIDAVLDACVERTPADHNWRQRLIGAGAVVLSIAVVGQMTVLA